MTDIIRQVEECEQSLWAAASAAPTLIEKADLDMALMYTRHALRMLRAADLTVRAGEG